jgi:hypothetical protein
LMATDRCILSKNVGRFHLLPFWDVQAKFGVILSLLFTKSFPKRLVNQETRNVVPKGRRR